MDNSVVTIAEIEGMQLKYRAGDGELDLFENMADEVILKCIKSAVKKANGQPFTVRMHPDWNESD
jgi:hypothetical protein